MKFEPIVKNLLDTDLYKINMGQVMLHKHPDLEGEYWFKCRNKDVQFTKEMVDEIKEQVNHLCNLRFTKDELDYLKSIRFIKNDYVEFLSFWHPKNEYINIELSSTGELSIKIKGPIAYAMQFEIYLLEIVNEVYFRTKYDYDVLRKSADEKLTQKIQDFNNGKYTFKFAEFGARRRLSREWQDEVVRRLLTELVNKNCVGTSNVYLAKKYNLVPIGTYAHEFVEMYEGIDDISLAHINKYAMDDWYDEYRGDNGTALSDTIGTDVFLLDFNRAMSLIFDGVRHDSGDPFEWGEKIISHYNKYNINTKTKTLLFSDSLDNDSAQALYDHFHDRIKVSFGIGTFYSNDTCEKPLNIVIKLQFVNGKPVAKLSDNPEKAMSPDPEFTQHLINDCKYRINREK